MGSLGFYDNVITTPDISVGYWCESSRAEHNGHVSVEVAMKVIEHGRVMKLQFPRRVRCRTCEALLEIEEEDLGADTSIFRRRLVICPECKTTTDIDNQ